VGGGEIWYLDTGVFVTPMLKNQPPAVIEACKRVLERVALAEFNAVTSALTWDEVTWIAGKRQKGDAYDAGRAAKAGALLLKLSNVSFIELDQEVLDEAQALLDQQRFARATVSMPQPLVSFTQIASFRSTTTSQRSRRSQPLAPLGPARVPDFRPHRRNRRARQGRNPAEGAPGEVLDAGVEPRRGRRTARDAACGGRRALQLRGAPEPLLRRREGFGGVVPACARRPA